MGQSLLNGTLPPFKLAYHLHRKFEEHIHNSIRECDFLTRGCEIGSLSATLLHGSHSSLALRSSENYVQQARLFRQKLDFTGYCGVSFP